MRWPKLHILSFLPHGGWAESATSQGVSPTQYCSWGVTREVLSDLS